MPISSMRMAGKELNFLGGRNKVPLPQPGYPLSCYLLSSYNCYHFDRTGAQKDPPLKRQEEKEKAASREESPQHGLGSREGSLQHGLNTAREFSTPTNRRSSNDWDHAPVLDAPTDAKAAGPKASDTDEMAIHHTQKGIYDDQQEPGGTKTPVEECAAALVAGVENLGLEMKKFQEEIIKLAEERRAKEKAEREQLAQKAEPEQKASSLLQKSLPPSSSISTHAVTRRPPVRVPSPPRPPPPANPPPPPPSHRNGGPDSPRKGSKTLASVSLNSLQQTQATLSAPSLNYPPSWNSNLKAESSKKGPKSVHDFLANSLEQAQANLVANQKENIKKKKEDKAATTPGIESLQQVQANLASQAAHIDDILTTPASTSLVRLKGKDAIPSSEAETRRLGSPRARKHQGRVKEAKQKREQTKQQAEPKQEQPRVVKAEEGLSEKPPAGEQQQQSRHWKSWSSEEEKNFKCPHCKIVTLGSMLQKKPRFTCTRCNYKPGQVTDEQMSEDARMWFEAKMAYDKKRKEKKLAKKQKHEEEGKLREKHAERDEGKLRESQAERLRTEEEARTEREDALWLMLTLDRNAEGKRVIKTKKTTDRLRPHQQKEGNRKVSLSDSPPPKSKRSALLIAPNAQAFSSNDSRSLTDTLVDNCKETWAEMAEHPVAQQIKGFIKKLSPPKDSEGEVASPTSGNVSRHSGATPGTTPQALAGASAVEAAFAARIPDEAGHVTPQPKRSSRNKQQGTTQSHDSLGETMEEGEEGGFWARFGGIGEAAKRLFSEERRPSWSPAPPAPAPQLSPRKMSPRKENKNSNSPAKENKLSPPKQKPRLPTLLPMALLEVQVWSAVAGSQELVSSAVAGLGSCLPHQQAPVRNPKPQSKRQLSAEYKPSGIVQEGGEEERVSHCAPGPKPAGPENKTPPHPEQATHYAKEAGVDESGSVEDQSEEEDDNQEREQQEEKEKQEEAEEEKEPEDAQKRVTEEEEKEEEEEEEGETSIEEEVKRSTKSIQEQSEELLERLLQQSSEIIKLGDRDGQADFAGSNLNLADVAGDNLNLADLAAELDAQDDSVVSVSPSEREDDHLLVRKLIAEKTENIERLDEEITRLHIEMRSGNADITAVLSQIGELMKTQGDLRHAIRELELDIDDY
eukprot:g62989.t1